MNSLEIQKSKSQFHGENGISHETQLKLDSEGLEFQTKKDRLYTDAKRSRGRDFCGPN